ncbi:ABC transporter permease [Rubrivirga sp. S365]|uniref:ABC transporter permease n=1 Tax=Rubrivirga sp. S365 TaxID=3076080 RepID=UPI0028C7CA57|nr:ABC transporter permease [Rubrivirga sp. S365]MDT7856759.1 ABC transporter permease [Rubrivirga sp. S365]
MLNRPNPLDISDVAAFWPVVAGLPLFLGLVAGLYPAVYVSAFQPTAILGGRARLAEKKALTRTLTVVQFTLALVTICLALFTATLDDKLLGGNWGYDQDNLLVVATSGPEQTDWLRREASALHPVRRVAGAANPVGSPGAPATVRVQGQEAQAAHFSVGPEYLATLDIEAAAGRAFGAGFADGERSVVVNRTFVQEQGWAAPVGQQVELDGRPLSVVGVVEDFLLAPMAGTARPVVFSLADAAQVRSLTLRVEAGAAADLDAALRARWKRRFPGVDYASYAQADAFARESMRGVSRFITYLAAFALLISCMGLFGLAAQGAARRTREVGVRKALGASAAHIVLLVNRGFLGMLVVATLVATPLCYLGLSTALRLAPVDVALGSAPFVLSNALVFLLAAATLSVQTARLVHVRPAEVLRAT